MTVSYLGAMGGAAERDHHGWNLKWPDGAQMEGVIFHRRSDGAAGGRLLSLDDVRIRSLATNLPRAVPGEPVPIIHLLNLPEEIRGFWSLWKVTLWIDSHRELRILPVFWQDEGRSLAPTARHLWDRFVADEHLDVIGRLDGVEASTAYDVSARLAKKTGQEAFRELLQRHNQRLQRDLEKIEYSISRRREAIKRVGLLAVRQHRLEELNREAEALRSDIERRRHVTPELQAVAVVRVEPAA